MIVLPELCKREDMWHKSDFRQNHSSPRFAGQEVGIEAGISSNLNILEDDT